MPIDEEEWAAGEKKSSTEKRLLRFLGREYPAAYSAEELLLRFEESTLQVIVSNTETDPAELERERIRDTLEGLVDDGLVERKTIRTELDEEPYYRANRDDEADEDGFEGRIESRFDDEGGTDADG